MLKSQQKPHVLKAPVSFSLPTYDSLAQAEGHCGIPVSVMRTAKVQGCPAFRSQRVNLKEFLSWYFSETRTKKTKEGNGALIDWSQERARLQAARQELTLKRDEGKLLDAGEVENSIASGMAKLFFAIDRVFTLELPARGKGCNETQLRDLAIVEIERLKEELRAHWQNYSRTKETP